MIAEACGATVERVASAALISESQIRQLLGRMKANAAAVLTRHRDRIDKLPTGGLVILVDDPNAVDEDDWYKKLRKLATA